MKALHRSIIALCLLVSLALTAYTSGAVPLEKSSQKEIELAGQPALGKLSVSVSADEISVAESLTLTIEIAEPAGTAATLPSFNELGFATEFTERSQRFRLTNVSTVTKEELADGGRRQRQTYTLEPWLSGDYAILPIMVSFYKAQDREESRQSGDLEAPKAPLFSLMTNGMRVKVTPLTEDRRKLSPLFGQADLDQKNLLKKERRLEDKSDQELLREKEEEAESAKALRKKHFPWWILWALLAVMVLLPVGWYLSRKKIRKIFTKKPTPPHIKASLALTALTQKELLQQGWVKEFYYELSFILREYIGDRFHIFAHRQTTEEFFQQLLMDTPFDSMAEQILRDFTERADTVKYSLFRPDKAQAEESLGIARAFVDNTAEKDSSNTP